MKLSQILSGLAVILVALALLAWAFQPPGPPPISPLKPPPKDDEQERSTSESSEEVETNIEETYDENPFRLESEGPVPVAYVGKPSYRFGVQAFGTSGSHEFIVKNEGDAPLKMAKGHTECSCTLAGLANQEVAPGEEGVVRLDWNPPHSGPFRKTAQIWTNDPRHRSITLEISGLVEPRVMSDPPSSWTLGTLPLGVEKSFDGAIYTSMEKDLQITQIDAPDTIHIESRPMTPEELKRGGFLAGYVLNGKLPASEEPGTIYEPITVHLNVDGVPTIQLAVTGERSGPLLLIGPKWTAGEKLLDLGKILHTRGTTHKLTLMAIPDDEPLQFTSVESDPDFIKVRLEPEKVGGDTARERYSVYFEIPPVPVTGEWNGTNPAVVRIHTNNPRAPELDVKMFFRLD